MRDPVVAISHKAKLLFSESGITKDTLAKYYERIAPIILPYLENRPLTLKHFPEGIHAPGYYRKHIPEHFPIYLKRVSVPRHGGDNLPDVQMATADEAADLIYLTGQNVIEYHMCTAKTAALDYPDQLIVNLDPHECDFFRVSDVALHIKEQLDAMHIPVFVKLSGRDGLHLHIPVLPDASYDAIRPWLKRFVNAICKQIPNLATNEHLKAKRGERVYLGITSNGYAQCIVAPYSVRAVPGAPIAAPLDWHEVTSKQILPGQIRLDNIFRRLGHRLEPWAKMRRNALSAENICALDTLS